MFVLGIDPGLSRCGYGLVERRQNGGRLRAKAAGTLETDPGQPLHGRLLALHMELTSLLSEFRPDVVVVERVFFQLNVRTAMSVGQASGLALAAAAAFDCDVAQYTPNEVKQAVVGYGAATKEQVRRMVEEVLGIEPLEGPADASDALALAVCHLTTVPLRRAVEAALAGNGLPPAGNGRTES